MTSSVPVLDREPDRRPIAPDPSVEQAAARPTLGQRLFKPGWPLAAILVPFPLWWVLGLSEWIVPIMVVPMALDLLRRGQVLVPRGFGWWMAFLLWVTVGGLVLQVDALGAVADDSRTRLATYGYRLGWYLSITIVLLYVLNTRRQFSTTRVVRIVAALFVTVTLGGLLGVLAPYFQFRSLAELLLPESLTQYQLIRSMIHPSAAQLQGVLGYVSPRPSAPFPYTNTWGLNFAVTLPFFLWAWLGREAGWRRLAAGPVLLVAAVPFIYSLNRGMWGACVAMALFVAVRAAITGKPGVLAGVFAGAAALALILSLSPLGTIVSLRFSNEGSAQGRTNLGTLAVTSVTKTSPVIGFGSTRNVQGNFQSITGGSTAQCPRCSPPSLGTQGQLWLVVFSQGLVGLIAFGGFFGLVFLRHIRLRSPVVTVALSALVAWVVTLPVYNSLGTGMLGVMVAVALLCRESSRGTVEPVTGVGGSVLPLDRYLTLLRSGIPILLVTTILGTSLGWLWHATHPTPYVATASVLLSEPPRYPSPGYARTNVDTDAQLVAGSVVRGAAAKASGEPAADVAEYLTVTATANTRVLHLHLAAPTASAAAAGVDAATEALVSERTARLQSDRSYELTRLRSAAATTEDGVNRLNAQIRSSRLNDALDTILNDATGLRERRNQLLAQAATINRQSARIEGLVLEGGTRVESTVVRRSSDGTRVALVSGATAGFGLGALLIMALGASGPRLRRVEDVEAGTGLPLLARVSAPADLQGLDGLLADRPMSFVAASDRDSTASVTAERLNDATASVPEKAGAVIVASEDTRLDQVAVCRDRLQRQDVPVYGLVVTGSPRRGPRWLTSP